MLTLSVTACGGSGSDSNGSGGETGEAGKGSGKPAAAKALPVESTARKATWSSRDEAHRLKIAPKRLARGTAADLKDVQLLDDDLKGTVPYYLTVSYTNTGSSALSQPTPQSNFTITLADGTPGKAISLWNSNTLATEPSSPLPDDCDKGGPAALAPGDTATACQLVMVPKGEPATVAYTDDGGDTLLWKVGDGKGDDNGGNLLPAHQTAASVWKDIFTKGNVPIQVTPKSVRAGSPADLSKFELSGDQKKLVPYYVTLEYRNTGKETLLPSMDDGVSMLTAAGSEVPPTPLIDFSTSAQGEGIDQCRGPVPNTRLKPKGTLSLCTVHLLTKGDRPAMIGFTTEGKKAGTLMWRAN
ncbi:hypothetical protein [Streptomyces flavofungini]|uniref:hypothetical protein n=1 Tax=Streptomyces flavofungini TaxID=68200 RepID=UPI0025B01FF7|nr:hypothetical protein [Streptomyces flavofungini]WJV46474.1 hypothetical protein QUY26_13575 [Streptomyces flavofungini]